MSLFLTDFILLAFAIAIVAGGLKKDTPRTILLEAAKVFLYLLVGVVLVCLYVALLPIMGGVN